MSASTSPGPAAPAGRRRFWVTVLAFALANALVWVGYHRYLESSKAGVLRIERFSHAQRNVQPRPRLAWTFNLDVTPSADGQAPGVIAPAVPGKWDWENRRTLTFTPDADLPKATRFTVTLPAGEKLATANGFRLKESYVSTFQTAPLSLTQVRQIGFEGDEAVLELSFDDAVNGAEVLSHLSLKGPDGKPLTFEAHGVANGPIVRVRTASLPAATAQDGISQRLIRLSLSPGLSGRSGPLAMTTPVETSVPVDAELIATNADAYNAEPGEAGIRINFNNAVDSTVIKPLVTIEPQVPFTLSGSYNALNLRGDFTPGTRYAIKLAAGPAGANKSRYPRPATLGVFIPDREPAVWFEHESGYLGSRGNRTLLAHAVNAFDLNVRITRLYDNNLVEWRNATRRDRWRASNDDYAAPVATKSIHLTGKKNEKQEIRLALDELLPANAARDGAYRVEISGSVQRDDNAQRVYASSVVTLCDLGLSAKTGRDGAAAWVTSLATAQPLPGVRVRVFSNKNQVLGEAASGPDGLAKIPLTPPAEGESPAVLIADRAGASEITWLDLRTSQVGFGEADLSGKVYLRSGHESFVYTDRGVYRPGETVHLHAIVRGPDNSVPTTSFPVLFQIVRPDLRNWRAQTVALDADGAAGFDLQLPSDLPTGKWSANVGLPGDGGIKDAKWFGSVSFQVEEFVPDRMKVELALGQDGAKDDARVELHDAPVRAQVQADYLFARPVAARPATLVARVDPTPFQPKDWTGWTFTDAADTAGALGTSKPLGRRRELAMTDLDASGHAIWEIDVRDLIAKGDALDESKKPAADGNSKYPGPWTLTATTSVAEEGGRAVSATRRINVDLVPYYIGIRAPGQLVKPGSTATFEVALVSPASGKAVPQNATLQAKVYRETWNNSLVHEAGRYRYETTRLLEAVEDAAKLEMAEGRGVCSVVAPDSGSYVLRIEDAKIGVVASVVFYAGLSEWDEDISRENPERIELILLPPKPQDDFREAIRHRTITSFLKLARSALGSTPVHGFAIDQRPRILVRSPFKGRLLLNVETDSVVSSQVIDMKASQMSLPIEVTAACRPNAYVTATVVRPIDPNAKWRAHRATGAIRLPMDNTDRKLNVHIAAPTEIRPATSLTADVRVTDSSGNAVPNAAITVAAVDEGICRLTNYKTPDPFAFFTATRALGVALTDLYSQLMPEVPKPDASSTPGGDGDDPDQARYRSPVAAKRVKPVALFSGVVHADSNGVAHVSFPVPQFAGELRLMAVAYTGQSATRVGFGSADQAVTVRSPLIVQSSWPRFAAPGDRFSATFTTFNNANDAGDAQLRLDLIGNEGKPCPIRFSEGDPEHAVRQVRLTPGGQSVTTIELTALDQIGVAKIRLHATLAGESFEETVELPIRPASPAITRGGFASASPDKAATIDIPSGMIDGTTRVQVNVTPWPALELPQGLDYLDRYPYGCAEQTISTLLPLVYLSDIGNRIAPNLFERERVRDKVKVGVIRLLGMRTADGGVAMWPGGQTSWPWASVYAAHFCVEARRAGHDIPNDLYDGLMTYARNLLSAAPTNAVEPLETQAYACYVLALAGKPERAAMSRLGEILGGSFAAPADEAVPRPEQARLHIAAAWVAAGRRDLAQQLIPKTLPTPRKSRQQSGNIGSPARDRAIILSALLAADPERAELPAMAQQLADEGRKGRWQSTQDTAMAVMALGRYLKQVGPSQNYSSVELWRADKQVGSAKAGESITFSSADKTDDKFEIRTTGPTNTKAYVSWLQVGVPNTLPTDSANGMTLRRRYLDDRGNPIRDDAVRSGDLVKVELTLDAPTTLENVVIEDLLPAGLEIENPRLVTQAAAAEEPAKAGPQLFEPRRVDMRDDRIILVGDLSRSGPATYVYTARAVTRGTFVVPPVRAECMYDIGTSAITGGGKTLRVIGTGSAGFADVRDE
jgi:uncharacterized protein YfaS (alpha-2-macroglobulin family)